MGERKEASGLIAEVVPRRGRGPARILFRDNTEVVTWDPQSIREAQACVGTDRVITYSYDIKEATEDKAASNVLRVLTAGAAPEAPEGAETALGAEFSEGGATPIAAPITEARPVPGNATIAPLKPSTSIAALEEGFLVAVRQRELLEQFIKTKFREGVHFSDGSMFNKAGKPKTPVLLQPGAQLILYAHGYGTEPEIIHGPFEAPQDGKAYTILVKVKVITRYGEIVGSALASCSSHIWSGTQGRLVPRAVDPDKTHNSTVKIAVKRAMVAACRQTTAAGEFFGEDLEEGGYGVEPPDTTNGVAGEKAGSFIRSRKRPAE